MTGLNRGEWSELYVVLYLLLYPDLQIVDSNLNTIKGSENTFKVTEVIASSHVNLRLIADFDSVLVMIDEKEFSRIEIVDVKSACKELINSIVSVSDKSGSIQIPNIDSFLVEFLNNQKFKSKSQAKEDLRLVIFDSYINNDVLLNFSVKSSLGNPPTLLNSSRHTNFKYKITNLDRKHIQLVNSIKSKSKLVDRLNTILELGGKIDFVSIDSETFLYNLEIIDTNMPEYLANTLLYSYQSHSKILKNIFIQSNNFPDEVFALKKLGDLLNSISFGFFPGTKWSGINEVNGGLLIVDEIGKVKLIDLIYHKSEVDEYLINNVKLDSPSSTRYNMLELYEEANEIFFTLNLQIRYLK